MMPQAGNRVIRHCRALRGLVVCYRRGARKASWRKWHFPGLESGWWNLVPGEGERPAGGTQHSSTGPRVLLAGKSQIGPRRTAKPFSKTGCGVEG